MKELPANWWGQFSVEVGDTLQWEIGPLQVASQCRTNEWLIAHKTGDLREDQPEWRVAYSQLDPGESEYAHMSRFVRQNKQEQLTALPALADRPVVTRLITPLTVPAGENAIVYVSTPLWFTLVANGAGPPIFEIPIQRPSDTWFGPSTREGEPCYASRTFGRLNLENLTTYQHRAITQVHIRNQAASPLLIERLNLPVPFLSLFHTPEELLWTEAVTMVQARGASLAEFQIEKEPSPETTDAEVIASPRQVPQKGMLVRAFSALRLQGLG